MPDNHDEEDVARQLRKTTTKDGPGFNSEDELPESDFDSFSEDDVENDHDGDNEGTDVSGLEAEVMADLEENK